MPDGISTFPFSQGKAICWDATCVNTFSECYVNDTATEAGLAAEKTEKYKRTKYHRLVGNFRIEPVAIETTGAFGPSTRNIVNEIGKSISEKTGEKRESLFHIFYNIRDFLSKENIKTIYYTLIYSRIKYGITLFGQAGTTKLKKIQTLQNQLLKVLLKKDYRFSTNELHKSMDLLKINDIADQEILSFVHNYFSKKLPPVFDDYYSTLAEQHQIVTRNGQNLLYIPNHVSNIADSSLKISGAKLWNNLDNNFKIIPKVKSFRKMFKTKLVGSYIANPQN